jgi:hypothetical protein
LKRQVIGEEGIIEGFERREFGPQVWVLELKDGFCSAQVSQSMIAQASKRDILSQIIVQEFSGDC